MNSVPSYLLLTAVSGCVQVDGLREPTEEEHVLIQGGVEDNELLQTPFIEMTVPIKTEMDSLPVEDFVNETGELLRELLDSDRILVATSLTKSGDGDEGAYDRVLKKIVLDEGVFTNVNVLDSVMIHEGFHGADDNLELPRSECRHSEDVEAAVSQSVAADPLVASIALAEDDTSYWFGSLSAFLWIEVLREDPEYHYAKANFGEAYQDWSGLDCETWREQQITTFEESLNLLVSETGFQYSNEESLHILAVSYPFIAGKIEANFRNAEDSDGYVFPESPSFTACE